MFLYPFILTCILVSAALFVNEDLYTFNQHISVIQNQIYIAPVAAGITIMQSLSTVDQIENIKQYFDAIEDTKSSCLF